MISTSLLRVIAVLLINCSPQSHEITFEQFKDKRTANVLPFLYDHALMPLPLVKVSINNKEPLWFVLDTGFDAIAALTSEAAKQLMCPPAPIPNEDKVLIDALTIEGIDEDNNAVFGIPPATRVRILPEPLAAVLNSSSKVKVSGMVGLTFLHSTTAYFDMSQRRITVFPEPHAPLRLKGFTMIDREAKADHFHVPFALGGGTAAAVLDTGSTWSFVGDVKLLGTEDAVRYAHQGVSTIDGDKNAIFYLTSKARIGDLPLARLSVGVYDPMESGAKSIIGMDVLGSMSFLVDDRNRQLHIRKSSVTQPSVPGYFGVELKLNGALKQVAKVMPKADGDRIGLKEGDCILSMDGVELSSLNLEIATRLIQGSMGQKSEMEITRKGRKIKLKFTRADIVLTKTAKSDPKKHK